MSLTLISPSATLAIDLADMKLDLRETGTDQDAKITRLIRGATARAEHETGRAIMLQDWELVLDAFPAGEIELAKPPVTSILLVTYLDPAGALQTLSNTAYTLDAAKLPGYLFGANGTSWPATQDVANAVRIRFRCGMATTAADLAAKWPGLQDWIAVQTSTLFDNRDEVALAKAEAAPGCYAPRLLDPFRTYL